jgi:uncharacterized protein (TIRG00374 family)
VTPSRLLRVAVAVGLTGYVLWIAHPARVAEVARGADWRWLLGAVVLVLVDRALMAYRWIALLVALTPGTRPPYPQILRVFFVSTFVGTFLPGIGGDVYRAYSLARLDVRGAESAASVLMDRVLGVLSIVLVGAAAVFALGGGALDAGMLIALGAATAGCAAVAVAVFSERAADLAQRLTGRLPHARLQRTSAGLVGAVRRYARHHGALAVVLGLSAGVQVIRILQAWCLGRALGIAAPVSAYFVLIPVILLVMLLPITINGLGTGQLAFDTLFGRAGVDPAQSFALSILFIALGTVGNLPGGLLYAIGGAKERRADTGG